MGRAPCCDKANVKKGPWSPEEDSKLKEYIEKNGTGGNWIALPQKAGLKRCGKSCRLRWLNYLRPNIKHGEFSAEEDRIICSLFANIGSRWSIIAAQLPGRTDNDIKNYWNTKLKKKLLAMAPQQQLPQRPSKHSLFTSSNQLTPHPLLPSHSSLFSSLYKDCAAVGSYSSLLNSTGFDSISSTLLSNTCSSNSSLFQTQEGLAMQYYHHPVKESNSTNMLVFGSRDQQASCSSNSDGSCGYGFREIKQEAEMGFHQQGYISTGFEENHKFMLSNYENSSNNNGSGGGGGESLNQQFWTEKTNWYFGEAPQTTTTTTMEYDHHHQIEDVKQYINGSSSSTGNNLFIDENKTQQEKVMYYYDDC